ncbi:hypothetical protein H072_10432 [Dactylellina haptotyla CBS 200.50]|uniref:Major facilitator superfamily (MFS) profile domain-containing protein n=1 Tax=Dactylellina haptotyla (strain CBS 200.50) TaxID=1284197 RepID=S7ZZ21_DACHA|nr:hypothetical protein H072_10432 [Dactylellina haptotyla CBS 200.50]
MSDGSIEMSTLHREGLAPILEDDARDDDALLGSENDLEEASKLVRGEPGIWVWLLVVSAGISGLLFGYDTAIISSALLQLANPPESSPIPALTVAEQSLVTSITSISALISSLCSGPISEYGRKKAILAAAIVFILGAVSQSVAGSVQGLIVGRFIVGLGVGAGSAVVPMYITELSPAHLRSRLNTLNTVFITLGQIVAYLIGYWYSHTPFGWRPMFLLGGVPAAIQIGLLFFLPESPRWLIQHGYVEQATSVLARIYGIKQEASNAADKRMLSHLVRSIERGVRSENELTSTSAKWRSLFGKRGNKRALLISGGLQGFQQLCGFNALMYFSSLIYAMLNFKNPTLTSLSVAATNFTFTLISLILIPKVGKRRLLLYSVPMMALGLLTAAYGFSHLPSHEITGASKTEPPNTTDPSSSFYAYVILFSTTFYVASYASGIGNVPWQQAEFFPMSVRSLGTAIATACNWSSNFIIGETFLGLMERMGAVTTFVLFAVICIIGWVGIYLGYPDTEGMNLEEIEALLSR